MQISRRGYLIVVFVGLFSLSQCVQNGSSTDDNSSANVAAADVPQVAEEERVNAITARRAGKSISFFPVESASGSRQDAARRVRFGDDEDANYINSVSNDISGAGGGSIEIGERRPVYAYKRPDDGSIYASDPATQSNRGNNNNNYYSQPYEYAYNDQGQYSNPQPNPNNYYSQAQGNYYQQQQQRPLSSPPQPQRPVSQTYQHIPYPQSQGGFTQSQSPAPQQHPAQQYSQYPQYAQYPKQQRQPRPPYQSYNPSAQYPQAQQQSYPSYSGPPTGPYYHQQQQQKQRPLQYDNYSPNYPYPNGGQSGESGVGGLLGGLGSLFSGGGLGGGGGGGGFGGGGNDGGGAQNGIGAVGGQFGYAIENIVRFDDYQCVPKIVCQMVGNPQRQSTLPSWLNAPTLTALISAVPSTNPMLVFGRAALLGLSGGENHCDSSYPRCPRNEDDVLNYLNNHRGGFFRFFNGGATYGDDLDNNNGYDPQQQYQSQQPLYQQQQQQQQQQYQQQPTQTTQQSPLAGLDLGTIQSIAEAINGGGGINLSNLGSNLGLLGNLASLGSALGGGGGGGAATAAAPQKQQSPASSLGSNLSLLSNLGSQLGLGNTVSNLLTGIVGARFKGRSSRKLTKRSTDFADSSLDELLLSLGEEQSSGDASSDNRKSKKRNLNKEIGDDATKVDHVEKFGLQKKTKKYHQEFEKKAKIRQVEKLLGVQARIINKEEIQAEAEERIVHGNVAALHNEPAQSLQLNPIIFPDNYEHVVHINAGIPRPPPPSIAPGLAFPNQDTQTEQNIRQSFFPLGIDYPTVQDANRGSKAFQFSHSTVQGSPHQVIAAPYNPLQFPETFQNSDGIILDIPKPLPLEYYDHTKMIFPDRRGTGNLRFDNDYLYSSHNPYGQNQIRIGRILTGANQNRPVSYQGSYNEQNHGSSAASYNRGDVLIFHSNRGEYSNPQQRPQYDFGNRYPIDNNNNVNNNRYQVQQQQQQSYQPLATNYYSNGNSNNNINNNRYQSTTTSAQNSYSNNYSNNNNNDGGGKVYVTNGQGIVTHYTNARGEKIAV